MKNLKRALRVALCTTIICLLIIPSLSGCGRSQDGGKTADGVVNFEFLTHGGSIYNDTPKYQEEVIAEINKRLQAELGFTANFNVTVYPDDRFDEKLSLDMAAKKSFDFIRMVGWGSVQNYYAKGMIFDLTEDINTYGSSLKENIQQSVWDEVTFDNKIYAIPLPSSRINNTGWIRKDLLDKYNVAMPTNLAEFENVLKLFKEKEGLLSYATSLQALENFVFGSYTDTPGNFVDANGKIRPKYYLPEYKDLIATVREWYAKGYVDDMLFNGNETKCIDLFGRGIAGINCGGLWQLEFGSLNSVAQANPDWDIAFLEPFQDTKKLSISAMTAEALVVPLTSKNRTEAIQFADWVTYNEENYNLVGYGIKDKTYVEKEEGDLKWREVPAGESANSINELFSSVYVGYNAKFNTDWVQSTTPRSVVSAYKLAVSWPTEKLYIDPITYTDKPLSYDMAMALNDGMQIINEYIYDIITGSRPVSDWDQMLQEFEELGGLEAYDEYTSTYKK